MSILEQFEQIDFSVASKSRQILCLTLVFIFTFIFFLKMGQFHRVWTVALSLIAVQVGASMLWSP